MAAEQSPAVLVARFLKANHYTNTLDAFLTEANLDESRATTDRGDWTLEKLIEEKIQFDTSLNFERRDHDANQGWTQPAPSVPREPELPINANVLCIKGNDPPGQALAVSTANNTCHFVETKPPYAVLADQTIRADGPILSTVFFATWFVASTTMSGKIMIHDLRTGQLLSEHRDHSKWVVYIACWEDAVEPTRVLLATAGWDQKINIYIIQKTTTHNASNVELSQLGTPAGTVTLQSNPESLVFVTNPDTKKLYLVASRRDSSFLFYYRIESTQEPEEGLAIVPAGRQNLAPHSNAWVAFTPSALALHPFDTTLLAVATSHLPHLKVIVVRLLFPDTSDAVRGVPPQTQAAMGRADLALQDREDAAITLQVSTRAPQTPYSTPQIAWRPDGSGVWVNGDDGVIRGVEAKSGKVVALLKAHEIGSKVRTLWAGYLPGDGNQKKEVVASGGFDKKSFIWVVDETKAHTVADSA